MNFKFTLSLKSIQSSYFYFRYEWKLLKYCMFYITMQFHPSTDQERLAVHLLVKVMLSVDPFDIFCVGKFLTYLRRDGYLQLTFSSSSHCNLDRNCMFLHVRSVHYFGVNCPFYLHWSSSADQAAIGKVY